MWSSAHRIGSYVYGSEVVLLEEVSRALNELAAIIAKLQYVEAELLRAKALEVKRQRDADTPKPDKDEG